MPRLSLAEAELVVSCLESVLENGKVDSPMQDSRPVSQVLARLKTRLDQSRGAREPRPRRSRRSSGATNGMGDE
jgi:hypothetical protein